MAKDNTHWHLANMNSGIDFIGKAYDTQMYGHWLAGDNRKAVIKIMRFSQVGFKSFVVLLRNYNIIVHRSWLILEWTRKSFRISLIGAYAPTMSP